jgi:hypothetical protein
MASAGVSQDPSPNRFGPSNSPPSNRIIAAEEDNRVVGPVGSQRLGNRTPNALSQGIEFPSTRSSPSTQQSNQSPAIQPHLNSDGSLANECGDSQPPSRSRDCDSNIRRGVGSVPLRGSLQASPTGVSRSPWSVAAQDPKSTFRALDTPKGSKMVSGMAKPFLASFEGDEDEDEEGIVGAADGLLAGGKSINSISSAKGFLADAQKEVSPTAAAPPPPPPPSRRPKGVIPSEQVTLPLASFNRLELLPTLSHPYEFTVKGDDDEGVHQ